MNSRIIAALLAAGSATVFNVRDANNEVRRAGLATVFNVRDASNEVLSVDNHGHATYRETVDIFDLADGWRYSVSEVTRTDTAGKSTPGAYVSREKRESGNMLVDPSSNRYVTKTCGERLKAAIETKAVLVVCLRNEIDPTKR